MEKAPEGIVGEPQQVYNRHSPEHVDPRLSSPRHAEHRDLPPPLPYGITTPPTASPTGPRFVTKANSDRLENGAARGNGNKALPHVGGRHLSPPPHPDTESYGVEAVTGDGDDNEVEEDDDDDIYTDDVHQDVGDHSAEPVAARTATETMPSIRGGPAVEPSAADIHPRDEQEVYHKDRDTLQKEQRRDVSGVEGNASLGGGVLASSAHGSAEEVHAA